MLLTIFAVSYVTIAILSVVMSGQVERFLESHPSIDSTTALEEFKELARANMYAALVLIPIFLIGIVAGLKLISSYGVLGFTAMLVVNVVVLLLGRRARKFEHSVRSLSATDELADEYRHVAHVWVKKALPDF